jgi:predicted glycoside hydrolase/deacetylase ChbG (UPF0249 family)
VTGPDRLLIVTADDVGLTDGVCRAVAAAHRDGVVTSASVLAVGRAFAAAVRLARAAPTLAIGAHLAMVGEDPPLLSAAEIPTLVDRRGRLPLSYRTVLARGMAGRIDPADVTREFGAQLDRVAGIGVPVTHLDTHQHVHLWPPIAAVVTDLASRHGIPAVRLPRSARRSAVGAGINLLSARLARRIAGTGLAAPAAYAGLDEAGALDRHFAHVLTRLAADRPASAEINAHPGESGDPELGRFRWGYRWGAELALLVDPATRAHIAALGFRLGSYAELARPARKSR